MACEQNRSSIESRKQGDFNSASGSGARFSKAPETFRARKAIFS